MDMNIVYTILILFFGMLLAFFLARWLDPEWRTKQYRRWFKKNYYLMYFVANDGKRLTPYVIDASMGYIKHKGRIWICNDGNVVEEGSPQFQLNIKKLDKFVKWKNETVPTIYVCEDTLIPLEFNVVESKVNSRALSGVIEATHINMKNRERLQGAKDYSQWILLISFIVLIAVGYVAYSQYTFMNDVAEGNIVIQKTIPIEDSEIGDTLIYTKDKDGNLIPINKV